MRIIPSLQALPRRSFLQATGKFAATAAVLPATLLAQTTPQEQHQHYYDVSTNDGLMREHGILRRVLLIYDEVARRIDARQDFPQLTVIDSADIIRKYIEDYHEKLEDEHIFPLFQNYFRKQEGRSLYAQKLKDLVDVLSEQHQAGRRVTDRIVSTLKSLKASDDRRTGERQNLAQDLRAYIRMSAPHVAREDTVLFPALHVIVTQQEYVALGEKFHEIEQKTFGGDGFDFYLDLITTFEKRLGIYDLTQLTPK